MRLSEIKVEKLVTEVSGTLWRVEGSVATSRFFVVKGYNKSRKVWKNKYGAGDFNDRESAQAQADKLNSGGSIRESEFTLRESKLITDVPNEGWLQGKIDYAKAKGRDSYGVPYMNATTAYVKPDVRIPVDILKRLPGMRGEQKNVRHDDLKAIMDIMRDTGKLPLGRDGEEYAPFVLVAHNGEAWVSEGNHRIMAAAALGWDSLPVELKYFDGGERVKSGPLYPGKIGLGDQGVMEGFYEPEEYNGIIMSMVEGEDGFKLTAKNTDGQKLGFVEFSYDTDGTIRAEELEVYEKYRGRGIAKTMYDYVKSQGYTIARSSEQTPDGAAFWDKNRPGKRIWEQDESETTALKLSSTSEKAKAWIEKVYAQFPITWGNNHVMLWGEGEGQQLAMFELVPSMSKRGAVDIKWFQAYPLRKGVGSRAMEVLLGMAQEDGITLTLYPWDKGQVISQAKLIKFYKGLNKGHGFKPLLKGAKTGNMIWEPQSVSEGANKNIPTIGINVRTDGSIDYASLIVDGKKKYESRKTDSLRPYVGKTVGIVRTGSGPAVAIGQVTIGEPIVVDAEKFDKLRKQHLVPRGSRFDIESDGTKYLYPMIDPVRWDKEKPIKHKGIVSRKIQEKDGGSRMAEAVNSQVFLPIFRQQEKIVTDKSGNEYKLVAKPGPRELGQKFNSPSRLFTIETYLIDQPVKVAWVNFVNHGDHLEAEDVVVERKYRKRGIATAMYDFARELGNDITASDKQTSLGKKFASGYQYDRPQDVSEGTVDEMALQTYKTMGDFSKPGPFTGADKKLVPHKKNIEKATKFFERTPYDFRLFFSNLRGTGKYSEHGPMNPDQIRQIFGQDAEEIIGGSGDTITVVYVGNKGDAKVMLTPWMMAHRFGHAIQAGSRSNRGWSAWGEAEEHFFRTINGLLEEHYNKIPATRPPGRNILYQLTPEYNALFNAIGTQRSSKTGQIRRPYEFLYELFAQYLGTGRVTLNPLPTNLGYGRKVFGNPTKYMNIKPEYRDEGERKQAADSLAYTMELLFNDVLGDSVGKIFVM